MHLIQVQFAFVAVTVSRIRVLSVNIANIVLHDCSCYVSCYEIDPCNTIVYKVCDVGFHSIRLVPSPVVTNLNLWIARLNEG
jgi:hypothetical protein